MRRYQQRQIFSLLETVREAQEAGLYADCQDGILVIGDYIENIKGEGTQTVALLEEYYKMVYLAGNGGIEITELRGQFNKIMQSVKDELQPERLEVVFFPYRVCMWDSLESIYLAACEDPMCDVHVVPIPFYIVEPDRTLGEEMYEGDMYPPGIPVEDWKTYDVFERHPDIIFIHYPYDEMGGNIRVHPDFFSAKLRPECEMLAYVPYYVAMNGKIDDFTGYLPGVLNADRVFVESQPVREEYIKVYKKYDKKFEWNGKYGDASEKFVALGSPKYDKVAASKTEDYELPDEWRRLIYCDGTCHGGHDSGRRHIDPQSSERKTVVLYNTHMFRWINNVDDYFRKVRQVLKAFRGCEDIVLWWRPHPGLELNFRLHKPEYVEELSGIIEEYKSGGWGIYDDTPDLDRAIACTDVYFGDGSSLVALYQAAGKPVIRQDFKLHAEDKPFAELLQNIIPDNLHDCGGYYIFSATRVNGLFKLDKETRKCEYLGTFPGEKITGGFLFACTAQVGSKIYFSPRLTKSIGVYDTGSGKIEAIPFPVRELPEESEKVPFYFGRIFAHGKNIYLIPSFYPGVLVYNTATGELTNIDDWLEPLQEYIFDRQRGYFSCGYIDTENDRLLLPGRNANVLVEIDLTSHTSKIHKLGDDKAGYVDILPDGDGYWLLDACKKGISYCRASFEPGLNKTEPLGADSYGAGSLKTEPPKTGPLGAESYETKLYQYKHDKQQSGEKPLFNRLTRVDDTIYLMPIWTEEILSFDVKRKQFSVAHDFTRDNAVQGIENWFGYFSGFTKSSDYTDIRIHVTSGRDGGNLIEYNLETGEVRDENLCVTDEASMKRFQDDIINELPYFTENPESTLLSENAKTLLYFEEAIASVLTQTHSSSGSGGNIKADGTAGKSIFDYCKAALLTGGCHSVPDTESR